MQRVIEGFTRAGTAGIAAASASQEEDDVLVGTLELPVEVRFVTHSATDAVDDRARGSAHVDVLHDTRTNRFCEPTCP